MKTSVDLITGATGAIGGATARLLVEMGHIVHVTDRLGDRCEELKQMGCRVLRIELTDEDSMAQALKQIEAEQGAIDTLVNCAGYSQSGPLEELPVEAVRSQFEVNVFGTLRLTQLVVPGMRRQGSGRIVNVSSVAGGIVVPGMGAYAMSKHSLECLTEALRHELRAFGIQVTSIQPAGAAGDFARIEAELFHRGDEGGPSADFDERLLRPLTNNPMELKPEKVAKIIVRAATAKACRRRYRVGAVARIMLGLRRAVPDAVWDGLVPMMFPHL